MSLTAGQLLKDRYQIEARIDQGGAGAVYRALDERLKQPCAVKENLFTGDPARRDQFEREAQLLARLNHQNLPRVTNHFILPNQGQYLVMDYVAGDNLAEVLAQRSGPLTGHEAGLWLDQICQALEYLHDQIPPIIHRDIKPRNIIITPRGQAILVDFGISKVLEPDSETVHGALGVTHGFSPPEQYTGSGTDIGSDIYALGATLYYLLFKQPPPTAVERTRQDDLFALLPEWSPPISPEIRQVIRKAMALNPQDRFRRVQEFRTRLTQAIGISQWHNLTKPVAHFPKQIEITEAIATKLKDLRRRCSSISPDYYPGIGHLIHEVLLGEVDTNGLRNEEFLLELIFKPEGHRQHFSFPYELIADRGGDRQLCLTGGSLIRVLDIPTPQKPLSLPINILIIVASPDDPELYPINGENEIQKIGKALGPYDGTLARLAIIKGPDTLRQIQKRISADQYHIIHLITHGNDNRRGGGELYFEDAHGQKLGINGGNLKGFLSQNNHSPSLVILNSCLTSGRKPPRSGQFSSVAWHLLSNGIPAVIAMQTEIEDSLAAQAAAAFYETLFAPGLLNDCVAAMRRALIAKEKWYAPILATLKNFNRAFFTEDWLNLLRQVNAINGEVKQRFDNDEDLISYVKSLDTRFYPLLRERNGIAQKILHRVKTELGS